jgi:hypothetical protein
MQQQTSSAQAMDWRFMPITVKSKVSCPTPAPLAWRGQWLWAGQSAGAIVALRHNTCTHAIVAFQ